ncbi:MAG: hypothetical protein KBS54_03630 [Synergistaceae bacterium]|nr:hypothetical protein [Candidatus Equadaptatus faecalis]
MIYIPLIILTILVHWLYHKIFDVVYFGMGAVVSEWVGCFFVSGIIVALSMVFWWAVIPILLILIVIAVKKKNKNKLVQ